MVEREIEIINKLGLHARASAKLTQTAAQFPRKSGCRAMDAASTARASWA
jgi:phosphotransferase system HPr (HPr) family protein